MPNWVYNSLMIEGNEADISAIKQQLNTPFSVEHDSWDMESKEMKRKTYEYNNPVFAFWNIIRPLDMETYHKQPDRTKDVLDFSGDDWYNWNVRNWGTKWDVAIHNDDKYPDTELTTETKDTLIYRFNTAWSPPAEAITKLSEQYPECEITLSFEEEQGWGGEIIFANGQGTEIESYQNKCRDCDAIDTLEYCENGCGEICSSCYYLGEAELDCVAECSIHMQYLDDNHVPEYRLVNNDN